MQEIFKHETLNFTDNQPLSTYYGPLLTQHVRIILESGLLLDEDYEVLLKASNFKIFPAKANKLPLKLIASTLTTIGSVVVAKRYDFFLVVLLPSAVTIGLLCLEINSMAKRRRHKEIAKCLVQRLIKLQKLNATIIRYTKLRVELSSKEKDGLLHNENFKVFIKIFVWTYQKYFKTCLQGLDLLANLTNELLNDFEGLKHMDFELILTSDSSSFKDFLHITSQIQNVYIFLSSKFLNYLALTFCKNLETINVPEIEFLLNEKLLSINSILEKLYAEIQKYFNNLRYCNTKKIEIETKNKRSLTRHVSGKLQQTLISAVNNLSIIMEKSQTVLHKVESAENENDVKKLESALSDLRDHAFATYESLNVLCKLYGIFSEANRSQGEVKAVKIPQKNQNIEKDMKMLSYDDTIDPLEENYELFIPKSATSNKDEEQNSYADQSGVYLGLMLKELRQSLKKHERFIAARDKRGINAEDETSSDKEDIHIKERKKPTPKFDLSALNFKNVLDKPNIEPSVSPIPAPRPSKLPPPPPLPPNFNLSDTNVDDVHVNQRSLLENIKTLSDQVQGKEDVFGSDSSSDSD